MKIVVVTGASSGMGREFVYAAEKVYSPDEIWVIARREERLRELSESCRIPIRVLALDLLEETSFIHYRKQLQAQKPQILALVNASGFGRFGLTENMPLEDLCTLIELNIRALVVMTQLSLPYMTRGSCVFQFASLSAFQPLPYMNIYAATKAFVLHYARALNAELRPRGIRVMAICPGWVRTEFFRHARNGDAITYFGRIYEARDVVAKAIRDMHRKKDTSLYGLRVRAQAILSRLLPQRLSIYFWLLLQRHLT